MTEGCQFEDLPDEVRAKLDELSREYEFGGKTWCPLHLPLGAKRDLETETNLWSEDQIEQFNSAILALIERAKTQNETCDLSGVVFPGSISFIVVTFPPILFIGSKFGGPAHFYAAAFTSTVYFEGAEFNSEASFIDTLFAAISDFTRVRFHEGVNFSWLGVLREGVLREEVRTRDTNFQFLIFRHAIFDGDAIFTNRQFLLAPNFAGAIFKGVPDFHGCVIHEGTLFPGREGFLDVSGDRAALAYTKLKNTMARFKRTDDEAMFYALELESKLNGERSSEPVKRAIRLYKWTADYGQSLARPATRLLQLTGFAFVAYFFLDQIVTKGADAGSSIQFAITLSLEQIFRPFAIWGAHGEDLLGAYGWSWQLFVKLVAAFQSAASIGLIALALFALRWRFKRP